MYSEKAVIGSILKDNYLVTECGLLPSHFEVNEHRYIFKNMVELYKTQKSCDLVTLITKCDVNLLGGANYLSDMLRLASDNKFETYCENIMDGWREREKKSILSVALQENWTIEKIGQAFEEIHTQKVDDYADINDLLVDVFEMPWIKKENVKGVDTGLTGLNLILNGLQNSELIILAARPSMGKSDVMLHLAKHAGWDNRLPIVFSLEMDNQSLLMRTLASTGSYSRNAIRDPFTHFTPGQKETWVKTTGMVGETKMQIFDKPGQTLSQIRMKIRKAMNKYPNRKPVVFIDYLTLIKPATFTGNMHVQIGEITKGLKEIAKEFSCPVVALAQLSRQVEQRQDKRPMMSDLRESGSIEEDADVVMFLYRDAYYSKDDLDKSLEIIIAKQRNGAVGTVNTTYNKFTGAITDGNN
jgi:replicative DNA helicase